MKNTYILAFAVLIVSLLGLGVYAKKHYSNVSIGKIVKKISPKKERKKIFRKPIYSKPHIEKFSYHGIDISTYQGTIDWKKLKHPKQGVDIDFIFMRATYGLMKDKRFSSNWKQATKQKFTIGAYHYYKPNINSTKQANNFFQAVTLQVGNLPPVVDIEKLPVIQTRANWRKGIKNFIQLLENKYGVKPIIYSGDYFYRDYLAIDPYFKKYPRVWIANYQSVLKPKNKWHFWQVSDKEKMYGINGPVDYNVFHGDSLQFNKLILK
jgi:lysozyme